MADKDKSRKIGDSVKEMSHYAEQQRLGHGRIEFDELGNAVFLISRLPGLIAHAHEERTRQRPMRQIDPKDHEYDGARERRLPETRK